MKFIISVTLSCEPTSIRQNTYYSYIIHNGLLQTDAGSESLTKIFPAWARLQFQGIS